MTTLLVARSRFAGRRPRGKARVRELVATTQGLIGLLLLAALAVLMVLGPLVAPHDPDAISTAPGAAPSSAHLLGTDLLGRDLASRVLTGGGSALLLPLVTVAVALALGGGLGLLVGYLGGRFDLVVTRLLDLQLAVPGVLLVLVIITSFGRGDLVLVAAVAVIEIPRFARVIRAVTLSVAAREFVIAARARGERTWFILFGEIFPNVLPTVLVEAALGLTQAVLAIAALSFLGLGVRPPSSNWAVMVSENRALLFTHPLGELVPALLLSALAVGISLFADGLTVAFGSHASAGRR